MLTGIPGSAIAQRGRGHGDRDRLIEHVLRAARRESGKPDGRSGCRKVFMVGAVNRHGEGTLGMNVGNSLPAPGICAVIQVTRRVCCLPIV